MKKFLVFFLAILALAFVACGKDKDIRDILDKEKISSEFNIVEEREKYFEFKDKDDNRDVFRIFMYEKSSQDELSEKDLFEILKEAKSFIK